MTYARDTERDLCGAISGKIGKMQVFCPAIPSVVSLSEIRHIAVSRIRYPGGESHRDEKNQKSSEYELAAEENEKDREIIIRRERERGGGRNTAAS